MNNEESKLQQQCVSWFRAEYPQYAMLLTHPINEGSGHSEIDRRRQATHKAEGTVAGVADLLFFLPSFYPVEGDNGQTVWTEVHGLGIEMKTAKGRQSPEQILFQQYFETAGYGYYIIRSLEQFRLLMITYINMAHDGLKAEILSKHKELTDEVSRKEREHFYKVIGKKMPEEK